MRHAMRRVALALLVGMVAVPAADARELSVRPYEFSPRAARLSVDVSLAKRQRVGVQLATAAGRPIGWIAEPTTQSRLRLRWKGYIEGKLVTDGDYRVRLLSGRRAVATIAASTPSDGSFDWTVPTSLADGNNYRVEVSSLDDGNITDQSDRRFTITTGQVRKSSTFSR